MLRAKRRGFFNQRYEITEDDRPVTEFANLRRESCEFPVDGRRHRITRERRKRFVLHGPSGWLATADLDSGEHCTISWAGGRFELVKPSMWRSAWELHSSGQPAGRIHQKGSTSTADLPADLDLATRLFAFYVVLTIWRRAAAATASASASGGA